MTGLSTRTRSAIRRTVITLVVLACVAGLVLAVQRTREGDPQPTISGTDTIVEQLIPRNGDDVLSQHRVAIDLHVQWEGRLEVAGEQIPEPQLIRRPELGQIIFEPGDGKVFERLPAGQVCATAIVWRVGQAESEDSRRIDWCFQVS